MLRQDRDCFGVSISRRDRDFFFLVSISRRDRGFFSPESQCWDETETFFSWVSMSRQDRDCFGISISRQDLCKKFPLPNPFFSLIEKCYNVPWVMKPNDKWTSRHTNQTTTRTTQKPLGDWDLIFKLGRWDWTSITSSLPLSTIYWLELPPSVTKDVIWAVTEINLAGVLKLHCVIILNL